MMQQEIRGQCVCNKSTSSQAEVQEHWFRLAIPHHDIEKLPDVLFAMPAVEICSAQCLRKFADELLEMGMK
jgi:hypothetical protein